MEGPWEGGSTQGIRDILAKRRLCRPGGVSVRQSAISTLYDSLIIPRMNLEALGDTKQIPTFHGAQCICDLGVSSSSLCNWTSCGICSIIKNSFTVFEFGATSNSGRYGKGIYSYFDPSMADSFATSSISSPYRVMLECEVNVPASNSNASKSPMVVKSVSKWTPCARFRTIHLPFSHPSSRTRIACSFLLRRPSFRGLLSCTAREPETLTSEAQRGGERFPCWSRCTSNK